MTTADVRALGAVPVAALTLWGEGRGEPVEGRIGIACAMRNRVRQTAIYRAKTGKPEWWGEGYDGVCLARQQFSCWNASDPNLPKLLAIAAQLAAAQPVDDRIFVECQWIASGVVGDRVTERVGNATHYYAASMRVPPPWATGAHLEARVGHHLFFSGVK